MTFISSQLDAGKIEEVSLIALREIAAYMRKWLPLVESAIRSEDEKELAAARAKVAEIEARLSKPILLGAAAVPTAVAIKATAMKGKPDEWAETDAGQGVGLDRREIGSGSVEDFRSELASLRERTVEKRRRRGLA